MKTTISLTHKATLENFSGQKFSTFDAFCEGILAVAESWLTDDKWMPQYFAGTKGPGNGIGLGMLPDFDDLDDLLAKTTPTIRREGLTVVAYFVLVRPSFRSDGEKKHAVLCVFSKNGPSRSYGWEIDMAPDGTVHSSRRHTGAPILLLFESNVVFGTARN